MAQYPLTAGGLTAATLPSQIGNTYNIGLSDGTRYYGYCFQNNGQQSTGMVEKSDVASKAALVNYGSPNLVDRDLTFYPRVSQGDFSGGGPQLVFLDPTRYFDSDLDTLTAPGYVALRPGWGRFTKSPITVGTTVQIVNFNGDFWVTFGEATGNVYSVNGGGVSAPTANAAVSIDTDGQYLYVGQGGALYRTPPNLSAWTTITTTLNGTATKWWVISQGTNGYFAYYTVGDNLLYKIDLSNPAAFPIAAGSQPQVPVGGDSIHITDIVEYQNGIAILSNDINLGGFDVWFHDGVNMTRIQRVPGYKARGICNALGDLYVGAEAINGHTTPNLIRIGGGYYEVVAKPGIPQWTATPQQCLQPQSSGQYVYWPLLSPSITGVSGTGPTGYVLQYDVISGAVSHLPVDDSNDLSNAANTTLEQGLRRIAVLGGGLGMCFFVGTTGYAQYQTTAFGTQSYMASGWLVSSHHDFSTPGISKRFRRIEIHHQPLTTGQSVAAKAFVDSDPVNFTTTLTPNPTTATVTHSFNAAEGPTAASLTTLTFGQDAVGKTLYYAVQLNAGASNTTTPVLTYTAIEVGGTWTWELDLDCSSKRRLLNGASEDQQGINGKDLYFLLRNAYENGTTLTLYLAESVSYSVAIESLEGKTPAYVNHQNSTVLADQEWLVHVVLRQVA